jgi:hypothetical protein
MFDPFKALDDAQKLRELDHRKFQRERAAWERQRAELEAEIARLTELTAAAGRIDVTENLGQDVLELRCVVSRKALFLSRDPQEVFRHSLEKAMSEFRAYLEERRLKADSRLAAAKAFSEARKPR